MSEDVKYVKVTFQCTIDMLLPVYELKEPEELKGELTLELQKHVNPLKTENVWVNKVLSHLRCKRLEY